MSKRSTNAYEKKRCGALQVGFVVAGGREVRELWIEKRGANLGKEEIAAPQSKRQVETHEWVISCFLKEKKRIGF